MLYIYIYIYIVIRSIKAKKIFVIVLTASFEENFDWICENKMPEMAG